MAVLSIFSVLRDYLLWHYGRGILDYVGVLRNYFWFIGNLFSVGTLITTLFAPFKRIQEEQAKLLTDPGTFFGNMLVNIVMRFIGAFVRLIMIGIAISMWTLLFLGGIIFFIIWIFLPFLVPYLFISGVGLLL